MKKLIAINATDTPMAEQIQIGDELKERLDVMIQELDSNNDQYYKIADIFMSATNQLKEAYVQLEAGHRYGEYERMITHMLHWFHPRFLELDAKWVDALIEAEGDMKSTFGNYNLTYLLMSEKLDNFDFSCRRFKELL